MAMLPWDELVALLARSSDLESAFTATESAAERAAFALLIGVVSPQRLPQAARAVEHLLRSNPTPDATQVARAVLGRPSRSAALVPLRRALKWLASLGSGGPDMADNAPEALVSAIAADARVSTPIAARLALLVYESPILPLDRPVLRILLRHGWLDLPGEGFEQEGYVRCERPVAEMRKLYFALRHVAETHCRRAAPRCTHCPLEPLLPDSGPLEFA